ncbi:membrane-associated phosphatidylinositol transfer protein 1-like isoform X2 [Pristis pectinata]|uniref:membrane-associated phosphatidylinositol transfer protein 1-like isoform X2 n=1 Tax=Pristis pectinata TaxID=685728 RepID=UPI00223E2ABE|nr:membrane-associated phosphatidylinositol transfer protein 1-like isoform X2 [Pristis pectinata]
MCAYKLCKVEFRYWGMQSKIEQFIHDVGLRRVMLRAHRQAWCWQDQWADLSMEEVRRLEEETARALARRMGRGGDEAEGGTPEPGRGAEAEPAEGGGDWLAPQHAGVITEQTLSEWRIQTIARDSENSSEEEFYDAQEDLSDSDEVFSKEISKWNSIEFVSKSVAGEAEGATADDSPGSPDTMVASPASAMDSCSLSESISSETAAPPCPIHLLLLVLHGGSLLDGGPGDSRPGDVSTLRAAFASVARTHFPEARGHFSLRLVPCPPLCSQALSLLSRLSPLGTETDGRPSRQEPLPLSALPLLATSAASYRELLTSVVGRANREMSDFLASGEGANFRGQVCIIGDCVGGILAFDGLCGGGGSPSGSRRDSLSTGRLSPDISTPPDPPHNPRLQGTRQLSKSDNELSVSGPQGGGAAGRRPSNASASESDLVRPQPSFLDRLQANVLKMDAPPAVGGPPPQPGGSEGFEFQVTDLFLFGCPLGLVLALRKTVAPSLNLAQCRPACGQVYNLFHPADPSAFRLEPLLVPEFQQVPPFAVPRYQKFPLGDGNSSLLADTLQTFPSIFRDITEPLSASDRSPGLQQPCGGPQLVLGTDQQPCGGPEPVLGTDQQAPGAEESGTVSASTVFESWWGCKRIDYALYCPKALTAFPTITLPHLFHASYWESTDVVAFILQQVVTDQEGLPQHLAGEESEFSPPIPRERWLRKRTQVKIRNVAANHRGSDTVTLVGVPPLLVGRFAYGPLDVVTLTGEKVDVYIQTPPPLGKWVHCGTETTNNSGRIALPLPQDMCQSLGVHPVRMFVRGDRTFAESFLWVVPPRSECVVFSIDGSFAASVSIMGSDPKVRAGAVDVVRYWQERGCLVVYVSGRPDMQKQRVVSWLRQHNFPQGITYFNEGLVHDPQRQKAAFLQGLVQEAQMKIEAAYGSPKDISVYALLNIPAQHIYIVGRPSRKWVGQCQFLTDGYSGHLAQLESDRSLSGAPLPPRLALAKGGLGVSAGGCGRTQTGRHCCAPDPAVIPRSDL